jgi:hypothetical protein
VTPGGEGVDPQPPGHGVGVAAKGIGMVEPTVEDAHGVTGEVQRLAAGAALT